MTGHIRACGLNVSPVLRVDFVHFGKVGHVGEEDVDLDDLVDVRAGRLENGAEVLDALVLCGAGQCVLVAEVARHDKEQPAG